MEITKRNEDVKIICVQAKSFPDGIKDAFDKIYSMVSNADKRTYYGISYMNQEGEIIYKAAAEEIKENEAAELGLEEFTIKKGDYLSKTINNFMQNIPEIGKTFQEMVKDKRVDLENGVCIEEYKGNDVICMIKIIKEN